MVEGNPSILQFMINRGVIKVLERIHEYYALFPADRNWCSLRALITTCIGVVVVLYICCLRSAAARPANNRPRSPSASFNNGFDNGIYAKYGAPPPEYEVLGKGKLSEYSPSEPPEYESIDPHPQKSYGVENMAYVRTIDVKMEFDNKFNENASEKN